MKRFWMVALVGLAAAFPLAFAQSETVVVEPFLGGGLSVGIPNGGAALVLQGGADNLLGPLALRGSLNIGFGGGASLGADVLNYVPSESGLALYFGGGFAVALSSASAYELHAAGGLEYFVSNDVALFAELQPAFVIVPGDDNGFGANLNLGLNYHFD